MKKFKYMFILLFLASAFYSCEDFLNEESKNSATVDYLQSTPEGLLNECVALYNLDRSLIPTSESTLFSILLDRGTDIDVFRAGGGAALFKYDNIQPNNGDIAPFWQFHYNIIGKTNEIITFGKKMQEDGTTDNERLNILKRAIAEASIFRAKSYFQLLVRYDRINLDTIVVTRDNVNQITFKPANPDEVLGLIYRDLDTAMGYLDWKNSDSYKGRFTKGVAKHLKAKVAMWKGDWAEAIKQVDEIDEFGPYKLLASPKDVFEGADLLHDEAIYTYQFSRQRGGGAGHRLPLIYTPVFYNINGFKQDLSLGGYAWGRSFPNAHLISLYDQTKDTRYKQFFRHSYEWVYMFPEILPPGKVLGQEASVSNSSFLQYKHTSSLKHFDKWSRISASETVSYKDVIAFRLAETYLLGAEAYMRKNGGNDQKALYYYNKTWMRAGNDKFNGPLTEEIILDEHARELHLEGVRFEILKRTGKFIEYVRAYGGETKAEAISGDFTFPRKNIKDHHVRWPIPLVQIEQMGGESVFPQNEGYQK